MVGQATFSGLRIGARSVKDRTIRSVRSRLHFLRSMRIGVMLFTIASMTQCNLTQENRPNFIFILSDDQGWTGSSVQMDSGGTGTRSDYYETPNLDRLARNGMRFSNGYSPASICTPSRRSIQFGQTPARQRGTLFESDFEPKGKLSMPLMLKSISPDYVAAHFGKWGHMMGASPEEVGYDESDGLTTNRDGGNSQATDRWQAFKEKEDPKLTFSVTRRANDFMERQTEAGRPFYLQISYYAVHMTMEAQRATIEKYEMKEKGKFHNIPAFAAMTEDLDTGLGQVLDQVERLGIEDTTYIFYMSDNGGVPRMPPSREALYGAPRKADDYGRNYPLRSGKWTTFEGGLRVPFVVKGPGIQANSVCDVLVVGWDLLPTLAALAGETKPLANNLAIDGVSFSHLLKNEGNGETKRSFEGLVFHQPFPIGGGHRPHSAIRVGDFKFIKYWKTNEFLLFNLKEDLGEMNNLAQSMPERAETLDQRLMAYLTQVNAEIPD